MFGVGIRQFSCGFGVLDGGFWVRGGGFLGSVGFGCLGLILLAQGWGVCFEWSRFGI